MVKYYRNFTTSVSCVSKFASYGTTISNYFIVIINDLFTNPASVTWLKLFFFFTHDQIFIKVFFHYFFTILILIKNCFNKFISSTFGSKSNYWLGKCIIDTDKIESKTARNVILKFFLSKNFHNFQRILNYTQNHHIFYMELVFVWNNF